MSTRADVIIIGGGIVGSAAAYYLCRQGIKPLVLERKCMGGGGSSRNAGGVRQSARDVRELPLAMYAVRHIWPTLTEELGVDIEYEQKGNLRLGKTPEHLEKLRKLTDSCCKMGLDMVMLDSQQAHELNPYMSDEVVGAAWCPSDGHANPLKATLGFYKRARELGAHFITGEEAAALKQQRGRIAQVVTDHGSVYESDHIVVAAGFESRDILNTVGIDIPMRKKLIECLVTEAVPQMFDMMLGVATADFYGHQTHHGSFVFGGGAGFGNYYDFQEDVYSTSMTPPVICRSVLRYFPLLENVKIVRSWAGWEDESQDGVPVVGAIEEIPGLYTACGFTGHGFGIGPMVGYELANLIGKGKSELDLSALRYNRFLPKK